MEVNPVEGMKKNSFFAYDFTYKELCVLSNGLLVLMQNAEEARRLLYDIKSIDEINRYEKELAKLNSKVCGLMKEYVKGRD